MQLLQMFSLNCPLIFQCEIQVILKSPFYQILALLITPTISQAKFTLEEEFHSYLLMKPQQDSICARIPAF